MNTLLVLVLACSSPSEDPDDTGAVEQQDTGPCEGEDRDQDGLPCEVDCDDLDPRIGDSLSWYGDEDGDGYGTDLLDEDGCEQPADAAAVDGDCDDAQAEVHPGAQDVCENGVDEDCSGSDAACPVEPIDVTEATAVWGAATTQTGFAGWMSVLAPDLTGDGAVDLVTFAYPQDDPIGLWVVSDPLSGTGVLEEAALRIEVEETTAYVFGTGAAARDMDGDGRSDLLFITASSTVEEQGCSVAFFAGPLAGEVGLAEAEARLSCWLATPCMMSGARVYRSVDGADQPGLAVAESEQAPMGVYLFDGEPEGTRSLDEADRRVELAEDGLYALLGDVEDLDGDGVSDLLVQTDLEVLGLLGPLPELTVAGDADLRIDSEGYGAWLEAAPRQVGDLDGDGLEDLGVLGVSFDYDHHAWGARATLWTAPLLGEHGLSDATASLVSDPPESYLGAGFEGAGDLDGDGAVDLALGFPTLEEGGTPESVRLYAGPLEGSVEVDDAWIVIESTGEEPALLGYALAGGLDADDDGIPDLAIGMPWYTGAGGTGGVALFSGAQLQ